MRLEKVGDSIRELLEENEILRGLMKISDYIIYVYTALIILGTFVSLGAFTYPVLNYLFFALLILAFAGRKYIGLVVLFGGKTLIYLYQFIYTVVPKWDWGYKINGYFSWSYFFGLIVCGLLLWLSIVLLLKSLPAKAALPYIPGSEPVSPNAEKIVCPGCGAECAPGAHFCPHCGAKF